MERMIELRKVISIILKKALVALLLLALLVVAPLSNVSAAVLGNDYPYKGQQGVDPWLFYKGECTSFIAWRMNHSGKKFSNNMKGGHFDNAKYWATNAKKIGFLVNRTPKVGAIAQFTGGKFGHVAYVAEVSKDKKKIKIEEYNHVYRHGYSVRTVSVSSVSNFIHVPGSGTTPIKAPPFPGSKYFKPGANNKYVTMLGKQLVKKGYGKYYKVGPGPKWSNSDKQAVAAFQRAQGWKGKDADGYPGPETWKRLFK